MFRSNKRQCIEKSSQGLSIITFLRVVQESGYVFGNIEAKNATTQGLSHGPSWRTSWRLLRWWRIQRMRIYKKNWLIFPGANKIETQRRNSIISSVPLLSWVTAPRHSVWRRSGLIYAPWIVIGPVIRCLCTGTITSRACITRRKYHTWYWRWQTTTFKIYIVIVSLNMEGIIPLT